jgi:G3E family GTPase
LQHFIIIPVGVYACAQEHYRLDAIVTVVDAKHLIQHLDDQKPEGVENEVCSTVVVVTL